MTKAKCCPFCGDLCEPCVDDYDKPVVFPGRGLAYYCEGCQHHWDEKTKRDQSRGYRFRRQLNAMARAEQ